MLFPSYTPFPRPPRDVTPSNTLCVPPLPRQALEEALNVQASPPPVFAGTLEPAGKVPQQELLTQNELLKQQVGRELGAWWGWEHSACAAVLGSSASSTPLLDTHAGGLVQLMGSGSDNTAAVPASG